MKVSLRSFAAFCWVRCILLDGIQKFWYFYFEFCFWELFFSIGFFKNLSKRELLKDVLGIIAKNVSLQRLYSLYKNQLNVQQMMQQEPDKEIAAVEQEKGEKAQNGEMQVD